MLSEYPAVPLVGHETWSTPVTWKEIDRGVRIEDFRIDNVRARIVKTGDLWKPLLQKTGRVNLKKYF